ncbi:SWIM zinc finger family protein [Nocardioides speluncae]|uniref:SWIM zinc finger family protein n=1 Tax=Nocardioides speluncae TaxID=2670337 RepID=UPI000D685CA3|nr:SWIM zinc finger family protein [Nocardioides speluncae]
MTRWTAEQVAKVAPDPSSLAAARRLASPGPWSDTGSTDQLVWGKCQGSGSKPYQVTVDLAGPAFKCSCPSRKFPCKHALALIMLWVDGAGTVASVETAADFAQAWAEQRAGTAARAAARTKAPPDPAAQAKRREERLSLMDAGIVDFSTWLGDLVRGGTAAARHQPCSWWDGTAARLVDAQLPGLAEQVRAMSSDVIARDDWADHLLATVGRWWTATRAWTARDRLSADEVGDLRAYLGWSFATDEIRSGDAVDDTWLVLGAHRSDNGRLQQQRTWLWGETTHEIVQVLDFAATGQALAVPQVVGAVLQATMARYPGTTVRRALFASDPVAIDTRRGLPAGGTVDDAWARAAEARAANPWAGRVPVILDSVWVTPGSPSYVVDGTGGSVSLSADTAVWDLLATSGGRPVDVFGELERGRLRILSFVGAKELVAL